MIEDGRGQLICLDVPIAREGIQSYARSELPKWDPTTMKDHMLDVTRSWEEVEKSAPTFEAAPFVIGHPAEDLLVGLNFQELAHGYAKDIRVGEIDGYKVLLADIVVYKPETIEDIRNGTIRDVSCGYDCDINLDTLQMTDIVGNHIALVPSGRGDITRIRDQKVTLEDGDNSELEDLANEVELILGQSNLSGLEVLPDGSSVKVLVPKRVNHRYLAEAVKAVSKVTDRAHFEFIDVIEDNPKKSNSLITIDGTVHYFENEKSLRQILRRDDVTGVLEFSLDGEVVSEPGNLPWNLLEVLVAEGFANAENSGEPEEEVMRAQDAQSKLYEIIFDHNGVKHAIGFSTAAELSDVLKEHEADIHVVTGLRVTGADGLNYFENAVYESFRSVFDQWGFEIA